MQTFTSSNGMTIQVKDNLSEITLAEMLEIRRIETEMSGIVSDMEVWELENDIVDLEGNKMDLREMADDLLDEYSEFHMKYAEACGRIVRIMTPKEAHKKIAASLYDPEWVSLYNKMTLVTDEEAKDGADIMIHIPGVNGAQIADLRAELKTLDVVADFRNVRRIKARIKRLSEHKLVLYDLQESAFAAYMSNAAVRKDFTKVPQTIEAYCKANDLSLADYAKERVKMFQRAKTREERLELKRREKELLRYSLELEQDYYQNIPAIISQHLIPPNETYNHTYAKKREPFIAKLTMDKLLPLVNFTVAGLDAWRSSLAQSSTRKTILR